MNSRQNPEQGVEVTLGQILDGRFISKSNAGQFLKVRVIFARRANVTQKDETVPPQSKTIPQEIGQIIFADAEKHIEGVFNLYDTHSGNAINKLIELKDKVIILKKFTVESRPQEDFYQTLLKKPTKRLRLSGSLQDFDEYETDESTAEFHKHFPFHFTPMENIYKNTVKRGDFIDVIAICEKYEDTEGANSKIKYRKALLHSTRSTKSNMGCSYQIAGFDNRKEIKCERAVYAMMNLKVTTFSSKQHKSLKITPSTIIVKLELAAKKRTDKSLDALPPDCRDQPYVLTLLPIPRARTNQKKSGPSKRKRSTRTRTPLQQLCSNCSAVVTKKAKNGN